MNGVEVVFGLEKMTIHQCQELAKRIDFNGSTFELVGPKGRMKARWLDAYMGFFKIEGQDGFIMVSQVAFVPDLHCENLMPGEEKEKRL